MNIIKFDSVKKIVDQIGNTIGYNATIDGKGYSVPLDSDNIEYKEILRQVTEKTLTIEEAD
jgi:hypothetical protein